MKKLQKISLKEFENADVLVTSKMKRILGGQAAGGTTFTCDNSNCAGTCPDAYTWSNTSGSMVASAQTCHYTWNTTFTAYFCSCY